MDDVRWFASNAYTRIVVPELRRRGLRIALEGEAPARVAFAMSGRAAERAWRYARVRRACLVVYIWDIPPRHTGNGKYDPVWSIGGRLFRLPRPFGGYPLRAGLYSRTRYVAARADALWVPSDLSRDILAERFGLTGIRVPYCYDSERFHPGTERRDAPPTLLTVSRLEAYKNQAAVLRAATRVGREVQVRLIGKGFDAGRLRAMAEELGLRYRLETDADNRTVERAYRTASVAVCPSRFEGFGLSPIEALASGTPVVASDIPPHREFVGRAARLVPPDDEAALVAAIDRALDDPAPDPAVVADLSIPAAADRILTSLSPLLR